MPTPASDTIVAIATPPGIGALGVVRLSGPQAFACVQALWRGKALEAQPSHSLHLGHLLKPDGQVLDQVVAAVFRAPTSYTREDVLELSFHGNPYILEEALNLLIANGARLAQPGEFTLRAFLNGALDLSQAEAVADLIAARSQMGHQLAMGQLRGGLSNQLRNVRQQLLDFVSLVELELDFSEEDVEFADRPALLAAVALARNQLGSLLASFAGGNAIKRGIPTVIVGKPNAGKSTLLNRLLNDNRAIVSASPGTTRDLIEETLFLSGYEFRLVDTAGLRTATDPIEAEGIMRSHERLRTASIVVYVYDATTETLAQATEAWASLPKPGGAFGFVVANKADLLTQPGQPAAGQPYAIPISAQTGWGVASFQDALAQTARNLLGPTEAALSNQRHYVALADADSALAAVQDGLAMGSSQELLSVDLRRALAALGEITGEVTADEVLGNIFSKFCIGK